MTKKTKPKKTAKNKNAKEAKAAKTDLSVPKSKPPWTTQEKTEVGKQKKTKSKEVGVKPAKRGRKPKEQVDSEVEIKVREIVKKTKAKGGLSEEKKESLTFNLDDVRAIIKKKSVEQSPKKKKSKASEPEKVTLSNQPKSKKTKAVKVKKLQTASIDDILGFGGSMPPPRPIRDEAKVPQEWKPYYNHLMLLRDSLKGSLGERSSETLGASAREASGELSINSSDSGTETFNRDVALSMVASEQEALEEIEDAIDRIFDGSFGVCQETKKPIKKNRLKVVPFTRFSLEGQTLYEQRKRKKNDVGGGIFATISDSTMGQDD